MIFGVYFVYRTIVNECLLSVSPGSAAWILMPIEGRSHLEHGPKNKGVEPAFVDVTAQRASEGAAISALELGPIRGKGRL